MRLLGPQVRNPLDLALQKPEILLQSASHSLICDKNITDSLNHRDDEQLPPTSLPTNNNATWMQDVQDIRVILQGSVTDSTHMVPFPTRDKKLIADIFKAQQFTSNALFM